MHAQGGSVLGTPFRHKQMANIRFAFACLWMIADMEEHESQNEIIPDKNSTGGRPMKPPQFPSTPPDELEANRPPAELSNEVQRIVPAESGIISQ